MIRTAIITFFARPQFSASDTMAAALVVGLMQHAPDLLDKAFVLLVGGAVYYAVRYFVWLLETKR